MIFHILSHRAWIIVSGACLAAALAMTLPTGLPIANANPIIQVRWQAPLSAAARTALERHFGLERGEQVAATTWRYEATNTSRGAISRLVQDPAVADTHYVDRTTFEIDTDAPRAARRSRGLALMFFVLAAIAALGAARPRRLTLANIRSFLVRGIPPLSPRGLSLFRLVFGVTLALYVYTHPFPPEVMTPDMQRPDIQFGDAAPIRWLVEHPPVVRAGQSLAIAAATLFALGILPRLFYAVATMAIVQWLVTFSVQSDGHPFGVLILPLLCLLVVPWGEAPPIFDARVSARAPAPASARYGYAPWLLSLALGVAWAAAAWAKVREGPGWVINGTVRYHFVSDAWRAPVDWGLTIATMPALAVAMSAAGVLIEGLTLPVAFVQMPLLRLAVGLAAMSLLTGFHVFQGHFWPAWWILLLGFVPWEWCDRSAGATRGPVQSRQISHAQLLCIGGLALQQLVISAAFIEIPPVASRYDMYSKTHASTADYDRENPGIGRRIVAEDAEGHRTDLTECARDRGALAVTGLDADATAAAASLAALRTCPRNGLSPRRYLVFEDQCRFDWNTGHQRCIYRDRLITTLPAAP